MTTDRQPSYITATEAALRGVQKRIRTVVPGTVIAYEPATRRALIQPAPSLVTGGREGRELPQIPGVPVAFPGGGGVEIVWSIHPGDPVTLLVFDRAIDRWLRGESTYLPNSGRMHSMSDVMAIVHTPPRGLAPTPGEAVDFAIRGQAGDILRATPAGTVAVGGPGLPAARTGDAVGIGPELGAWLVAVTTYINGLAPGTLPSVPTVAGLITGGSTRVSVG